VSTNPKPQPCILCDKPTPNDGGMLCALCRQKIDAPAVGNSGQELKPSIEAVGARPMFDPKCYELAEHFLPAGASEARKAALAQDIQGHIEMMLTDAEKFAT
jgi:hypothetical protein